MAPTTTPRPRDLCPHERPFPAGFDGCAAYLPAPFIGLDTHGRPLPMVWTCTNFGIGDAALGGGHYPRCLLGDAQARKRWVRRRDPERVRRMRELRRRFAEVSRPHIAALWEAKARAVKDKAGTRSLHEEANSYLTVAESFVDEHAAELDALGFPPAAARTLLRAVVDHWLHSTSAQMAFQIPDHILEKFPPAGRLFIQPHPA